MEIARPMFGCPKPHRLIVEDKKTQVHFLIAPDSHVSLFPKFSIQQKLKLKEESHALVNGSGLVISTFGKITQQIDLGLGQDFTWKFALVNYERPIIGRDFLSHFQLQIDFNKMCLLNPRTGLESSTISTVACECFRKERSHDGWPSITGIFERPVKHRFHVTDKITQMQFLVTRSSQISIFPKSELTEDDILEPFNGSFEIVRTTKEILQVEGMVFRTLDFGTGRRFSWKFAVVECNKPIIGEDFLSRVRLANHFANGYYRLFDVVTRLSTVAPYGPCDCGNGEEGWPSVPELIIRHVSKSPKHKPSKKSVQSNRNPRPSNQTSEESQQNPQPHKRSFRSHRRKSVFKKKHTKIEDNEVPKETLDVKTKETLEEEPKKTFDEAPKANFEEMPKKMLKEEPKANDENNHRLHVDDKNSKLHFLISIRTQLSIFPKSVMGEREMEPFDGNFELVGMDSETDTEKVFQVLGWTTLTLDIGLEKEFTWKFAVIDIFDKPILGKDFIGHHRLEINSQGLVDMETKRSTPPPSGPCDCGKSCDELLSCLKIRLLSSDGKPDTTKEESGTEAEEQVPEENKICALNLDKESEIKHRFHINDRNTDLPFLITSTAEISVYPRSKVQEEDMEPFDGTFELEGSLGETWQILGWKTLSLDIGFAKSFTLRFAVTEIEKPILGLNFLSLYGLSICKEGLIDPETKILIPASSGPCDCDKPFDGWPNSTFLLIKPILDKSKQTPKSFKGDFKDPEKFVKESELKKENVGVVTDQSRQESEISKSRLETFENESQESSESFDKNSTAFTENCDPTKKISEKNPEATEEKVGPVSNQLKQKSGSFEKESEASEQNSDVSDEGSETSSGDSDVTVKRYKQSEKKSAKDPEVKEEKLKHESESLKAVSGSLSKESEASEGDSDFTCANSETDSEYFVDCFENQTNESENSAISIEGFESEEVTVESDTDSPKTTNQHRFHVLDKCSQIQFFVSEMAQVSVFPISQIEKYTIQDSKGSEFISCNISVLPIYGWITLKLDFGLEREFEWNFAVSDFSKPIIGRDFLSQYGLECVHTLKGSHILDTKTMMRTPEPAGPCDCETSIHQPFFTNIKKSDSTEMLPSQEKMEIKTHCELAADGSCPKETRLILTERETGMPYFVSTAALSVFPKSRLKEEEIEAFDDSFDLINTMGSIVPIYGLVTRKMDFGLGRYFVWKFPVMNVGGPIIGDDFLQHYGLTISHSDGSAFDYVTEKTAFGSKEFCSCQAKMYWPDASAMRKMTKNLEDKKESKAN